MRIVQPAEGADPDEQPERAELVRQFERRREAALRLPPMECGCRDPDEPRHAAGQCRYRPRNVA